MCSGHSLPVRARDQQSLETFLMQMLAFTVMQDNALWHYVTVSWLSVDYKVTGYLLILMLKFGPLSRLILHIKGQKMPVLAFAIREDSMY